LAGDAGQEQYVSFGDMGREQYEPVLDDDKQDLFDPILIQGKANKACEKNTSCSGELVKRN
jgi:hypothetical protein